MIVKPLYYLYVLILSIFIYALNPLLLYDFIFLPKDEKGFVEIKQKIKPNYFLYFFWIVLGTGTLLILCLTFNKIFIQGFYKSMNEHPFLTQWTERKKK